MERSRPASDRVRPFLEAMERSIDAVRQKRMEESGEVTRPASAATTYVGAPATPSAAAPVAATPQPATPPAPPAARPQDDPANPAPPARLKARPKRPSGFGSRGFNDDKLSQAG